MDFESSFKKITSGQAIIFIWIAGIIAYFNSLFNGFVWDDEEQVVSNTIIHSLSNISQIFSGATFSSGGGNLTGWFFRPLLTLSYMLNYAVWRDNAFGFHLFSILFHLLNATLLFKILQKLNINRPLAFILALIFVVHSATTEAVVYIAAVSELLYTFFNLLAFYLLTKWEKFSLKKAGIVSLLTFSGLLFKESSIVIFPILVIYLFLYKTPDKWKWTISFLTTSFLYFLIRLIIVKTPIRHPEFSPISEASLFHRVLTIPAEFVSYLKIIVFPKDLAISQHFVITDPGNIGFLLPMAVSLIFITGILILGWKLKSKPVLFGLAWFLIAFGLVSNIFPLDMTIAERWLYFPLIGLILVLAGLLNKLKLNSYIILSALFIALILGVRTMVRNSNWANGLALYTHDIQISKNSFDLENNLGVEQFRSAQFQQAKTHFENSIKLQPKWYFSYNNLGAVYEHDGDYTKAKEYYLKTLSFSDYYLAYENLAGIYLFQDRDFKKAHDFSSEALKKLPLNPRLWFILGLADYKLNDKPGASKALTNSFNLQPTQQTYQVLKKIEAGEAVEW